MKIISSYYLYIFVFQVFYTSCYIIFINIFASSSIAVYSGL